MPNRGASTQIIRSGAREAGPGSYGVVAASIPRAQTAAHFNPPQAHSSISDESPPEHSPLVHSSAQQKRTWISMRVCNFLLFAVVVLVHVNAQPTETESEQVRLPLTESSFKTSSGRYLRVLQAKDNDAIEERGFNFPWLKKLEKFIPGTLANKAAAAAKAKAISEKKAVEALAKVKEDMLYKAFAQGERDDELFKMFKTWKSEYSPAKAEKMMTDAGRSDDVAKTIRERYYYWLHVKGTGARALRASPGTALDFAMSVRKVIYYIAEQAQALSGDQALFATFPRSNDAVSSQDDQECAAPSFIQWDLEDREPSTPRERYLKRAQETRRERARRTVAALAAEKKRRREFHEVKGRFYADHLMKIRSDVSFDMMCENISAIDRAARRSPHSIEK
ncbi:hypothetical protein ON010_g7167 [Phytophthora cinnamomi]|nr:hypothetical protein ON010_g7167 [Phytophthora cinnamomi]